MRCGDCKHWNQDNDAAGWLCFKDVVPPEKLGYCRVESVLMHAVCEGEAIYGDLITQADFGCVLFEEKEKVTG